MFSASRLDPVAPVGIIGLPAARVYGPVGGVSTGAGRSMPGVGLP